MTEDLPQVALSIRQPWAWLIVHGHKDVENRTWRTKHRGRFVVHAPLRFDAEGYDWVTSKTNINMPAKDEFCYGGFIGIAEITDCVESYPSIWFTGPYGFVLREPRPISFIKAPGRLGFFKVKLPIE